jgi:hypothetical protein
VSTFSTWLRNVLLLRRRRFQSQASSRLVDNTLSNASAAAELETMRGTVGSRSVSRGLGPGTRLNSSILAPQQSLPAPAEATPRPASRRLLTAGQRARRLAFLKDRQPASSLRNGPRWMTSLPFSVCPADSFRCGTIAPPGCGRLAGSSSLSLLSLSLFYLTRTRTLARSPSFTHTHTSNQHRHNVSGHTSRRPALGVPADSVG